jgi:hypothetical protein
VDIERGDDVTSAVAEPLDVLVEQIRSVAGTAVEPLQVAAVLESHGVTDRVAADEYGRADVFELADDVYRLLAPVPDVAATRPTGGWRAALRDLSHGLLYLLPTAMFPAVFAVLGRGSLVLALVLVGLLGWVWSGAITWLGYQWRGRGQIREAASLMRRSTAAGLVAAAGLGAVLVWTTGAGYGLLALVVGVMAYQLASTLLVFYRKELWLGLAMAPAVGAGVAYLRLGHQLRWLSIVVAAASVLLALALGLLRTVERTGSGHRQQRARWTAPGDRRMLLAVVLYTALTAVFLLHAEARYLLGRLDIVLAVTPLLAGMGLVEWRAHRFDEHSRQLLTRVASPRGFVARMRRRLAAELLGCVGAVGVLAAGLLYGLSRTDRLGPAGVVFAAAFAALAGSYFVGFILAGRGRYGRLAVAVAVATAVHGGAVLFWPHGLSPFADGLVFLGSVLLLQVLLIASLAGVVSKVWLYR